MKDDVFSLRTYVSPNLLAATGMLCQQKVKLEVSAVRTTAGSVERLATALSHARVSDCSVQTLKGISHTLYPMHNTVSGLNAIRLCPTASYDNLHHTYCTIDTDLFDKDLVHHVVFYIHMFQGVKLQIQMQPDCCMLS